MLFIYLFLFGYQNICEPTFISISKSDCMSTKYTIKYHRWFSSLEQGGGDYVFFECTAYCNNNPPKIFPVFVTFELFLTQAQEMFPRVKEIVLPEFKYHKELKLPESKFVCQMEELGYDLEAIVMGTITTKMDLDELSRRMDDYKNDIKVWKDDRFELLKSIQSTEKLNYNYSFSVQGFKKSATLEVVLKTPIILN